MESKLTAIGFSKTSSGIWYRGQEEFWQSGYTGLYLYKKNNSALITANGLQIFKTIEEFIEHIKNES